MGETLGQKQQRFSRMVARLLNQAHAMGYEVTLGDAFRDPRLHGAMGEKKGYGAARSCHKLRLAVDLNLFKDGAYLQNSADHKPLGEWWEKQGGTWGGRFNESLPGKGDGNDGNHYSLEHEGCK